jgi:hypothetical protein
MPRRPARFRRLLALFAVAGALAAVTVLVARALLPAPAPAPPGCTVGHGPAALTLSPDQAENAATITAVGLRLGLPPHAAVIALATALQESKLHNLPFGDRDSLGLFQQRPSTGWGTPEQVLDAERATRAFYGGAGNPNPGRTRGLLDIPGWRSMSVTQAAQAVQLSAFPDAYAKWEPSARAWLAQLG